MAQTKKYELVETDKIYVEKRFLYRIKALRDIGFIKAGTIGGYIENESNLDQEGECFLLDGSIAYGTTRISGNMKLRDDKIINSTIAGTCSIISSTLLNSSVTDSVIDDSLVRNSTISKSKVRSSKVTEVTISDDSIICDSEIAFSSVVNTDIWFSKLMHQEWKNTRVEDRNVK